MIAMTTSNSMRVKARRLFKSSDSRLNDTRVWYSKCPEWNTTDTGNVNNKASPELKFVWRIQIVPSTAKTKKRKKGVSYGRLFGGVFYIVFLALFVFVGAIGGWLGQSTVMGSMMGQLAGKTPPSVVFGSKENPTSSITLLILGCDEIRNEKKQITESQARSDMIMVARMDFRSNIIGAVSVPRDTWCDLPGYQPGKINKFHAVGGPELSKRAVEHLLPGVQIDRVVSLDFKAFQEMVDLLGGVEIYVARDMKYNDNWGDLHIDLKKGRQILNGYDAMGYVRYRKGDSDFERQKRHREFMLAMKERMMERLTQAPAIAEKSIELAGNAFTAQEVAALLLFASKVGSDNIRMGQVPVADIPGTFDLAIIRSELEDALIQYRVLNMDYKDLLATSE